jgi:curli biogenesis system outer membrane secretion channel CsgG
MKKFLVSLIVLTVFFAPARSQTDRKPKPKTTTSRELGQPETPQPQTDKSEALAPTVARQPTTSNRKRKIMVLDFDARGIPQWWGTWDVGSLFANVMVSRLARTDTYDVVERERMKALIDEQNLTQDERFRQEKVTRIGQLLGADSVLFGYLTNFSRKKSNKFLYNEYSAEIGFSVRLVDISSGKVLKSEEITYVSDKGRKVAMADDKAFNPNDPDFLQSLFGKAINESIAQAVQKLTGETESIAALPTSSKTKASALTSAPASAPANDGKVHGSIAAIDGNTVIINRGQAQGIKIGDMFEVTRGGITDPETGRMLRPKVIGEIRITNVEDASADGEIVSQKEKLVTKDLVVSRAAKP